MSSSDCAARARRLAAACACLVLLTPFAVAFTPRQTPARFDLLVIPAPDAVVGLRALPVASLSPGDPLRAGWDRLALDEGGGWEGWIDERSGLPTLAIGRGVEWFPVTAGGLPMSGPPALEQLEALARAFMERHPVVLGRFGGQLRLDRAASGPAGERVFLVTFGQVVDGVPVVGARYDFQVVAGRLVAFGATRWSEVHAETTPRLPRDAARAALDAYLGIQAPDEVVDLERGTLHLLPIAAGGNRALAYAGPRGAGYTHRLTWRFAFAVPDEPATWVAEIDASTGEVVSLVDETRYARVKGGIYPLSNDGIGPEGTEQPGFPMPFADAGATQSANDQGVFSCSSGTIVSSLAGPYIRVSDKCGAVSASATCPRDIDLGDGPGTDCAVPPGASPGNTHAARSSFYHLNRVMEKGRSWLPGNGWLASQVVDNVNINNTCNAFWNGTVNFYRSGGGCRNTGELQGVFVHEWGHGLDANDGGGYDNPSEAYADIVAFMEARESCVGRGFFVSGNCSGYGDACLDCSGIRDQDWGNHQRQLPATPTNFLQTNCGGGDGPCGREGHCEAYVSAEAVWDLAARDLPAAGLDPASAWQLAEKLFYLSRTGSGGNAYNCALPSSDGCGTGSWYHKFRLQDDNDGNLTNGTPHAAAIYAAFARHGIACGAATDPTNRSSSTLPAARPARPERRPERRGRPPVLERRRRDLALPHPAQRPRLRARADDRRRRRLAHDLLHRHRRRRGPDALLPRAGPVLQQRVRERGLRVRGGDDRRARRAHRAGPRRLRLRRPRQGQRAGRQRRRVGDGPDLVHDRAPARDPDAGPVLARLGQVRRLARHHRRARRARRRPALDRHRRHDHRRVHRRRRRRGGDRHRAPRDRGGRLRAAVDRRRRRDGDHRPRGDDRLEHGRAVRQRRHLGTARAPAGDGDRLSR